MMNLENKQHRHEIKCVIPEIDYEKVLHAIAVHPASFQKAYATRKIHTLYFDTYDYSTYRQNLSGTSSRIKVRYRWYGDSLTPDAGQLEIKCKRNRINWKEQFPVPQTPYYSHATWRDIVGNLLKQISLKGKMWLHEHPQPMMVNRYRRQYFISADRQFRATIDSQLKSFDQRYKPFPNIHHAINIPRTIVLEIKCPSSEFQTTSKILAHLPFRVSRHSKYMTGLKSAQGY